MKYEFIHSITKKQCSDTGLAMILISTSAGLISGKQIFHMISLGLVIIMMTVPMLLYPFAIVWFGFSKLLGILTSNFLLGVIFFMVITPVAIVRRILGKDRLLLKGFKKGQSSVFINRYHKYIPDDLTQQF